MMAALPMPWLSLITFIGWLLLMGEVSLLAVIGAALFGWLLPLLGRRFVPQVASAGKPVVIARLVAVVIHDIVKSNVVVARLVLGSPDRLRPAFVTVPVDTDHPYVINLLASIITMTPGTVSSRVHHQPGQAGSSILVHVLDCPDGQAIVREIKVRYEAPLREIFNC